MTITALARLSSGQEVAEVDRTDQAIHNFIQGFPLPLRHIKQANIQNQHKARIDLFITGHLEEAKINAFLKSKGFKLYGQDKKQKVFTWEKRVGDQAEKVFTVQYSGYYGALIVDAVQYD